MADACSFRLLIDAKQSPPAPFSNFVTAKRRIEATLPDGNLTDQVKALYGYEATIAGSGTFDLNLNTDLDRYGLALAADDLALLLVENVDDGTGTGALELRPHPTTNPLTNLLGAGSAVLLPRGSGYLFCSFTADALDVTAANCALRVVETSGQPTKLRIQAWVRR